MTSITGRRMRLAAALILIVSTAEVSWADTAPGTEGWGVWGTVGLGLNTMEGISGIASVEVRLGPHLFELRAADNAQIIGDEIWDIGILYGRFVSRGTLRFAAHAGVAIVGGSRGGDIWLGTPREPFAPTVGGVLELDATWLLFKWAGIGLTLFGDLNPLHSFAGGGLTLSFGALRS